METACWPGYVRSGPFAEQVREIQFADGARAIVNAPLPDAFTNDAATQLILYATPNGNSIEQTLGCRLVEGTDWHYDIQHIAAQVRRWRVANPRTNIVLVCLQSDIRSWPTWRREHANASFLIRRLVDSLAAGIPADEVAIVLAGHSGGGSFLFGYIDAVDPIPHTIQRIIFLDANYGYSDDDRHGKKIVRWLRENSDRQFVALAYDDRNITLNGKRVVSPTGGTYRASHRMIDHLRQDISWARDTLGAFDRYRSFDGRLLVCIHPNPENQILHTGLVGEMNGLLYALAVGSPQASICDRLESRRLYVDWIQPVPYAPEQWRSPGAAIPRRSIHARGAARVAEELEQADLRERERIAVSEMVAGNVPDHLRAWATVSSESEMADGTRHRIVYRVMPDYLSIGSDTDFFRMPLTPQAAQHVADLYGWILPTRKMVDQIYRQAPIQLDPLPFPEPREAFATFLRHHDRIEDLLTESIAKGGTERKTEAPNQGSGEPAPGPDGNVVVGGRALIAGIKKDVVITNQLESRPGHVAIYGWHRLDGTPIQPLTTVHIDRYVDYSHGARLVDPWVVVDGHTVHARDILADPNLHVLLSDEGPIHQIKYRDSGITSR